MEMICPDCNLVVDFDRLPMRLQTCEECAKDGSSSYLIVTLERRQPIPGVMPTGRAGKSRRLAAERPAT